MSVACALPALAAESVKFKPLGNGVYQDNKNIPLKYPEGVACSKASVIVADTGNGRLVRYTLANDELKDGVEVKASELSYPLRLSGSAMGRILALDGKTRKIARLAADGSFVGYLDYQNVPAPSDVVPRSVAVDDKDNVYVLDILGERVVVVDPGGKFLRQIPFPKGHGNVSDLAVDQRGAVYVLDSQKSQVYKAAPNAQEFQIFASGLQSYLYFAVSLEVDSQGRVYLLDQDDSGVIVLSPNGSFQGRYLSHGWKIGQLNYPAQACITDNGIFVIADRNNSRVQLFKIQ
jgi:DNA-binding beta-propeller fold protein YncE